MKSALFKQNLQKRGLNLSANLSSLSCYTRPTRWGGDFSFFSVHVCFNKDDWCVRSSSETDLPLQSGLKSQHVAFILLSHALLIQPQEHRVANVAKTSEISDLCGGCSNNKNTSLHLVKKTVFLCCLLWKTFFHVLFLKLLFSKFTSSFIWTLSSNSMFPLCWLQTFNVLPAPSLSLPPPSFPNYSFILQFVDRSTRRSACVCY